MNSIDNLSIGDIRRLEDWASENMQKDVFPTGKNMEKDSYYETRHREDTYITVYDFDTLPELEMKYEDLLGEPIDKKIRKISAISAMRYRPDLHNDHENEMDINSSLPEHIYVF